jgi:PAS domain S-box-containing protein
LTKPQVKKSAKTDSFNDVGLVAEANYRALFEYAPDGILIADAESYYLDANPSICQMLGYTRDELIGMHATDIILASEAQYIQPAIEAIKSKSDYLREWQLRRKDGSVFTAEIIATTMPDGNLLGLIRDITLLKQQTHEIAQLSRLYAALTKINQAIIWLPSQEELFNKVCQILVEEGGFQMAWMGWNNPNTHQLEPVASWGDNDGYLKKIKIYSDERPEGMGPSGLTFRSGKPYICNNMQEDQVTLPWRDEIVRRGFRAAAFFPIHVDHQTLGTLSVYAAQPLFFHDKEVTLLEEATSNISFALQNIVREEERKRAECIANNEKLFSDMMLESMPGILYFYDHDGRFLRWNQNFATVSGYADGEIAQMQPLDFFDESERATVAEKISEVFTHGLAFVEANLLTKDGQKIPYFFTGRNVNYNHKPCLVGMGIDISERKHIEIKLNESEQKYRELVESANSIILRWNAKGCITFMNQFGEQFFGYSHEEIIGKHVIGTIVPFTDSAGRDLQDLMQQICLDTKKFEQNINENMRRNGEHVWIAWTNKVVLDAQGQLVEILSIGTDITERLNAEKEIKALNANLELRVTERTEALHTALVRAEAADKIKSAFLATMSHELRTPLNSIIGFTGIILQGMAGPLNAEQTKQLGMVRGSAKHLLALINDVLDISKIEAGQLEVRAEPFDLTAAIEKVADSLKPIAEKKGLVLNTIISKDLGEIVSDQRRLSQILINLLNNAIKFTEKGSVTLTAEFITPHEKPTHTVTESYVKLSIADTGMGIKPEEIKHLFQPFHQIDSGLTRLHEGTGLGLAICKKLLDLMGGQITVASEWSKGTEFIVTLPLKVVRKS